jgi:DNA-binding HxlR family transcriptional regulator
MKLLSLDHLRLNTLASSFLFFDGALPASWYIYDTNLYRLECFQKDTMQDGCTVNLTVRYIARKWTLLILLELYKGKEHTRRFSVLKGCLKGITQNVLSARLKELEREGLIENKVDYTSFPVKSEYKQTESGLEISNIIKDMKCWALKWKITNIECSRQDCSECIL